MIFDKCLAWREEAVWIERLGSRPQNSHAEQESQARSPVGRIACVSASGSSTLVAEMRHRGGQYDCPFGEKEGSFMRMNFPFRHKIAIMAVAADISMSALIYVISFHFVSMDEVFLNSRQDHPLYFFLIDAWGWLHVPVALLPVSSPIFCYEICHAVGIIRNTIHMILCFSQTYGNAE
jgi:hypothetical protein